MLTYVRYRGNNAFSMGDLNSNRLFVYGSLLDRAVRIRILGREPGIHEATLPDYERRRKRYFYIVAKPGSCVVGGVISGLKREDFERLDRYEEAPILYTRAILPVADSPGSRRRRCWVYLPTRAVIDGL